MNNNTLHKLTKNMTVLDAAIFKGKRGKFLSTHELRALALFAEDAKAKIEFQANYINQVKEKTK